MSSKNSKESAKSQTVVTEANIADLIPDDKNMNKGTQYGRHLMDKSLRQFGAGRPIAIDKNNRIIAGNKTTEVAGEIGIEDVIIVETDGTKLVAVKRTDIDLDTKEGREMAAADNATSAANLDWDTVIVRELADKYAINTDDWGIKLDDEKEKKMTEILSGLEYNPLYHQPAKLPNIKLEDCINLDKFNAKLAAIGEYDLTDAEKETLKWFAYRFIKIDFESVASFYAFNASEEMKKAIERLRLVLTDDGLRGFVEDDLLRIANLATESIAESEGE